MLRKSKKSLAILLTLAMLATMLISVPMASAATSYENVMTVQTFEKGVFSSTGASFAKIKVTIPEGAMALGATENFYLRFPSDVYAFTNTALTSIPVTATDPNQVAAVAVTPVGANTKLNGATICDNEYRITVTASAVPANNADEGIFYIELQDIFIPSGSNGDVLATIEAMPGTVFSDGAVVVARTGSGSVSVAIDEVNTITDANGAISTIRFKEDMAGALDANAGSVKVKLPKGFYWDTTSGVLATKWGGAGLAVARTFTDFTDLANTKPRSVRLTVTAESTQATYLELTGLNILVDEQEAVAGDIECAVSGGGDTTVANETMIVARYGDYTVDVEALTTPTLLAGKENQKLGKFVIKEQVPNSLIGGRTITLTLPEGAKWDYDVDNGSAEWPVRVASESDLNGLVLWDGATNWAWEIADTERRVLKTRVRTATLAGGDPAKVVFKEGKIALEPGFRGDLTVTVDGSAGASAELVLAKVMSPAEGVVTTKNEVKIGYQDQLIDDLVITENKKEAIARTAAAAITLPGGTDGVIVIDAPAGVTFSTTPTAEVISGDMDIEKVWASADRNQISIRVNATSDAVSSIKVSGLKVTLDRTVPEGDLKLNLMGSALINNNIWDDEVWAGVTYPAYFTDSEVSSTVVVAKCITPGATDVKNDASFVIGSTTYKVNGIEQTMDVAPYIKDSRTYMPLRYVALALGVAEQNILWDAVAQTATLIKGDKVVQVKIGSTVMLINGVSVNMDVAPEISADRTMLPLRWIGQAFGADFTWDEATQTATMNL